MKEGKMQRWKEEPKKRTITTVAAASARVSTYRITLIQILSDLVLILLEILRHACSTVTYMSMIHCRKDPGSEDILTAIVNPQV
jgi:hypothetical protein